MNTSATIETWVEFGISCLIVPLRVFIRVRAVGIRKLRGDDYLAVILLLLWCGYVTLGVYVGRLNESIITTELLPNGGDAIVAPTRSLLKVYLTLVLLYICFLWIAKAALLFYYSSFKIQVVEQRRAILLCIALCVITFIVVISITLGRCGRVQNIWESGSLDNKICPTRPRIQYVSIFVCHLVSDLCLLAITVPIIIHLWTLRIAYIRKFMLAAIVCTGLFTIVAAIVLFALIIGNEDALDQSRWIKREMFFWMIVINAPSLASLVKDKVLPSATADDRTFHLSVDSGIKAEPKSLALEHSN